MAEFTGKDCFVQWVWSGGTVALTTDFRRFTYTPTQAKFDTTTSNETDETYLTGIKGFTASYEGLGQAGGTATWDPFVIGTSGTLTVGPEGTATGKRKFTFPCFTTSDPLTDFVYNDLVKVAIAFQGNGAITRTTY